MMKPKEARTGGGEKPPVDHERILGLAVNTLGRNITWSLARRTASHGVFPGVNPVIAWLMQLSESTQAELSQLVGIEQPHIPRILERYPIGRIGRPEEIAGVVSFLSGDDSSFMVGAELVVDGSRRRPPPPRSAN